NSLILLDNETDKIEIIKKDIHVNALKLYHKYASNLDMRNMSFNFLKANKKVIDLFINKPSSIFGDYVIETLEKITTGNKRISYYKIDEANFMLLWANRIGELTQKSGTSKLTEFLKTYKEEKN
ncbi:MAG: hypothetical protein RIQ59_2121, partial [Bacteroidota bacterium]